VIKWINTDFGDNPIPPLEWFKGLRAAGYTGFITPCIAWTGGAWWGAPIAFDRALTADLQIATYARPPEMWDIGLAGLGSLAKALRWFELDVEPQPDGLPHPVTQEQIDGLVLAGQRPVIYAYAGEFIKAMGYDPGVRFATIPLNDRALRTTVPNAIGQKPITPFNGWNGPWTRRKIWQCVEPVMIGGIECAINVVDSRWI